MNATVRLSKGNKETRSPAQGKVKNNQASIGWKQSVCEDSMAKEGEPDNIYTVHGVSRR